MADLTITAANVAPGTNAVKETVTAGATITAGQAVYLDSSVNKYKLVDNDAAGTSTVAGVALNAASDGQPVEIITKGPLNPGATVTVGTIYCSSSTAGGIAPSGDLASGDFVSVIGCGTSSSNIDVNINNSGVAVP